MGLSGVSGGPIRGKWWACQGEVVGLSGVKWWACLDGVGLCGVKACLVRSFWFV